MTTSGGRTGERRRERLPVPGSGKDVARTLAEIERGRRSLWRVAFVILIALSLAVVVVSYWKDSLPDAIADVVDVAALRFVFLVLSLGFIAYVMERERRFRRLTDLLVDERSRVASLEARLREVSALAEVGRSLRDVTTEEEMLGAVVRSICRLLETPRGIALVADPDAGILRPGALAGFAPGEEPTAIPLDGGALGKVASSRAGTVLGPGSDVPWARATASLVAPLVANDELIGLLWTGGEGRAFSEYELRLLGLVAEQAAIAVANVRAYAHERDSVRRLAELDRMKTDFIAAITHELKTPLTSLLGYATILRRRGDTLGHDQREEFFGIMSRQGERILRLIEELLQSSRIEAGTGRLRRERLDLVQIVERVGSDMASVAREHTIELDVPGESPELYGDPVAIEHIITNLVDNAFKYSRQGTRIHLRVAELENEVRISVADEGAGIAEAELPYVFDRFRQAQGPARGRGSVGLGLYIVRGLVEAHGGRVWVDSVSGRGSTFTFSLPRRRRRDEEAPGPADEPAGGIEPIEFPA